MADLVREWNHLTWSGRLSCAWYPIRRLFVAPAPDGERCVMGSRVGGHVHCPRYAFGLWCKRHQP